MLRWTKWVAPMAALVLMAGIQTAQTRADDTAAPTPNGKATVTVTVVDSSGKAVAGATVSIFAAPAKKTEAPTSQPADGTRTRPTPMETGTTGTDGTFALTKIPDGKFMVTARLKGSGNGRATVTISDDKDEPVSVTLKPRAPKN